MRVHVSAALLAGLFGLAGLAAGPAGAADDLVNWRSIAKGEAESAKSGKPVLYFMTAEWCGPCRTMRKEVFADRKIAQMVNATFIPIEVVDRTREEGRNVPDVDRLMRLYRIRGFPTLTVSHPGSRQGFQAPGWSSRESTIKFLEMAKDRLEQLEKKSAEETR